MKISYIFTLIIILFTLSAFSQSPDILFNGTVSAESNQIKNVADPTDAQDAVTKNYIYSKVEVDSLIAQAVANLESQINNLNTSVLDIDGNSYNYLTYGDQLWTVENAEMVTYRDGTPIPQETYGAEWQSLTTGAWCYINNDPSKGKLYNWYAVAGIHDLDPDTPNKELAPEGWHVSSNEEWTILENYLIDNGNNYDGTTVGNKIAKSMASSTGWNSSGNTGGPGNDQSTNNSSGFNAFPEGGLGNLGNPDGGIENPQGVIAIFWCSEVWHRYLGPGLNFLASGINPSWEGFSVRFVKD
mgnify:FL=1